MLSNRFAVIDVETTGKGIHGNRITEICIVVLENLNIVEKFTSLVNPEQFIPPFITGLTGIDNDLVKDAPKFHEIAGDVWRLTQDAIFVAHNVNFDFNVIRGEFKGLGQDFIRKKLCTVRLSRKLFPGLNSYSLGKLCRSLHIPLNNRHRAEGDTDATVLLLKKILKLENGEKTIDSFLNTRSKEATLPPHLNRENLENLPEETGIYLFMDEKGKVIYAGKAKNIKQRVTSHFYDKKNQEYLLAQETHRIDHEVTGNELIALLLEAEKIAKHYPKFNRAQKKTLNPYCITAYENKRGIMQLALTRGKFKNGAIDYYFTREEAVESLEQLCISYELCPRFCGLQSTTGHCSHYKINTCRGVCVQGEDVDIYNLRVKKAIKALVDRQQNYIITGTGRKFDEHSFVLVKDGVYKGFGYADAAHPCTHISDFEPFLIPQKNNCHTERIIKGHLRLSSDKNIRHFKAFEPKPTSAGDVISHS